MLELQEARKKKEHDPVG